MPSCALDEEQRMKIEALGVESENIFFCLSRGKQVESTVQLHF